MIRGTGGVVAGRTIDGTGVCAHVRQREPLLIAEESLELRASVRIAVADHVAFARLRRRRAKGRDEVLVELERGQEMTTIEEIRRHRVGVERRRRRRHRRPGSARERE